jgi:Rrf2 family protein
MRLVNRDTDYAIRAICFIAQSTEKIISVSELVKALKVPRSFLRKILQLLNKKKLLKSYKGQGGGFSLLVPVHRVFLLDLIEIFQEDFKLNECFLKKDICPNTRSCQLKDKLDKIENYVLKELKSITIADLLR